jgi:hypothetical protein
MKKLLLLFILSISFAHAQQNIAEIFSPRIKNQKSSSSFYFRILNVNQQDFNSYVTKSNSFVGLTKLREGYSLEHKIGSIYFSSTSQITLEQLSQLMKFLNLHEIHFDGKKISVDEIKNQTIIVVERNDSKSISPRKN